MLIKPQGDRRAAKAKSSDFNNGKDLRGLSCRNRIVVP